MLKGGIVNLESRRWIFLCYIVTFYFSWFVLNLFQLFSLFIYKNFLLFYVFCLNKIIRFEYNIRYYNSCMDKKEFCSFRHNNSQSLELIILSLYPILINLNFNLNGIINYISRHALQRRINSAKRFELTFPPRGGIVSASSSRSWLISRPCLLLVEVGVQEK